MKSKLVTGLLLLGCLLGLCLALYPSVSRYWNDTHATRAIGQYTEGIEQLEEDRYEELWLAAQAYNVSLCSRKNAFSLTEEQKAQYETLLNTAGDGIMGYLQIPKLSVSLPVYHGTEENVLQVGVGHLSWSSLPTGGKGTHCVVSGHRGVPGARLLTDLDELQTGDLFTLTVLKEVLTYEVDQIRKVEPTEVADLRVDPEQDYCTLVTCTPFGINTHRLLVRGHRVETESAAKSRMTADAVLVEPVLLIPFLLMPPVLILVLVVLLYRPARRPHP